MPMDWVQNTVIIPRMELCFHIQEKCASSSTKAALRQAFVDRNGIDQRDWAMLRDKIAYLGPITSLPNWKEFLRITIVRDPWARLLSAWRNKIIPDAVLLKELDSQTYFDPGMSFERFVEKVCARPDATLDRHLHLQIARMYEGQQLIPAKFYQFENLSVDWPRIQNEVNDHCGLTLPPLPHLNRTKTEPLTFHYDRRLANMVEKRYQRDLEIFNQHGIRYRKPV